jgi:hypothetical protein
VIKQIVVLTEASHNCQVHTKFIKLSFSGLTPYIDGIIGHERDFNLTFQLLIIYFAFIIYMRNKWEYTEAVH